MLSYFIFFAPGLILLSQETDTVGEKPITLDASYIADLVNNLVGGAKTGSLYLGMANIVVGLNTESAGLWKGGLLLINASNTHGGQPSGKLIGDIQVASNIESGNHLFMQELWFRQEFERVALTGGLQDLNVEFANTENGSLFLNSSFGILPTISCNLPAPIFPLTALGLSIKWQVSDKTSWLAAIYDGSPTDFENNPYNVRWELNSEGGALAISEMHYSLNLINKPGTYKFGVYTHHHSSTFPEESGNGTSYKTNYGFYAIADQTIWKASKENRSLGMFIQFGITPKRYNYNYYYAGIGFNYAGLVNRKGGDVIGIALAHAGLKGNAGNETTLELSYRLLLTEDIFIQPDFQYISNPAGTAEKINNSFVAVLRFGIKL